MDRDWGSKPGSGGAASAQNEAIDRRERLRRLALETIDLAKDPYFMRNHLGRAAREAKDAPTLPQPHKRKLAVRRTVKIGRPGYRVTKQYDLETKQRSLLFQIEYPEIEDNSKPRHRFMSSFEQRIQACDKRYQYLLFHAEPYEIISFKVPSTEIDKSTPKFFSHWDPDLKMFTLQLYFKAKLPESKVPAPPVPSASATTAPGVPPRPLPPVQGLPSPPLPPQGAPPPPAPAGSDLPRAPLPPMAASQPPPPPPTANGLPRPMPPPMAATGAMANFTPGFRPPMQAFPVQQVQGQLLRPPPPPSNLGPQ
ncbi:hypothetical protein HPP92_016697 [Vanilla planifolia]|uniref:SF3A2 domain-containing protein n=1 Tax=Vanilla planifolia TaxID=51239 RepID=A0A835UUG5_VANPL|nr:hypothetical protein HPP92_016697 [Vanilla planifolia]